MKLVKFGIFAFALSMFIVSCDNDTPAEEAAEDTEEYMEDMGENIKKGAENTMNEIDTALDKAGNKMEEGVENVKEEVHDATH